VFHHGQPESRAIRLGGKEWIEDSVQEVSRDAGPGIADFHKDTTGTLFESDLSSASHPAVVILNFSHVVSQCKIAELFPKGRSVSAHGYNFFSSHGRLVLNRLGGIQQDIDHCLFEVGGVKINGGKRSPQEFLNTNVLPQM